MRKYKNKIIAGVVIAAVFALVFLWGGNAPGLGGGNIHEGENVNQTQPETALPAPENFLSAEESKEAKNNEQMADGEREEKGLTESKPQKVKSSNEDSSETGGAAVDGNAGKDNYQSEPAPEDRPLPAEPENAAISDKELSCTLSVRCDTILKNTAWLDMEKLELVPEDGVIYAERNVTFYEGESVFNLLVREMKRNKIHMEFENTPVYNSAYIEGIGNIYEFDCGELSGWMYKVNDRFPNYGCSRYLLKEGDKVEWVYTCDLGADVGGAYVARNGR